MTEEAPITILIIEDEPDLRSTLQMNLQDQGYRVLTAANGHEGLEKARGAASAAGEKPERPHLILLDLMLPGIDGLTLLRALRRDADTPVLILSARATEMDKIIGLEIGADDYLTKPFSLGELLARVRAMLRRVERNMPRDILAAGGIVLNLVSRRATRHGQELILSPKEFSLLAELIRNERAVLSRDLLLAQVWGYDFAGDTRTVDVHIRWLREKIEEDPSAPQLIQTVRGIGYRFDTLSSAAAPGAEPGQPVSPRREEP